MTLGTTVVVSIATSSSTIYEVVAVGHSWYARVQPAGSNSSQTLGAGAYDPTRTNTVALSLESAQVTFRLNGAVVATGPEDGFAPSSSTIDLQVLGVSPPIQADFQDFVLTPLS
jgi:hypothetical protein